MLRPKSLFLLDCAGAALSVLLLLLLIAPNPGWFGMPPAVAKGLALPAFLLAGFGAGCATSRNVSNKIALRCLAGANLCYIAATAVLLIAVRTSLTSTGAAYFAGELTVIIVLAAAELRTANHSPGNSRAL